MSVLQVLICEDQNLGGRLLCYANIYLELPSKVHKMLTDFKSN